MCKEIITHPNNVHLEGVMGGQNRWSHLSNSLVLITEITDLVLELTLRDSFGVLVNWSHSSRVEILCWASEVTIK